MWEAVASDEKSAAVEAWRKRLQAEPAEFENILHQLHIQEFVNWMGAMVDATTGSQAWKDYLQATYRLGVKADPRALVVAETIADSLKRAPHTMARHYKQSDQIDLRSIVGAFDCQRVPAVLFDSAAWTKTFRGLEESQLQSALASEVNLLKLPQTVHVASCYAFDTAIRNHCDEDRCVVGHTFEEGIYTDDNQKVWLVAELEAKVEVDIEVAKRWFERLESLARKNDFSRYHIWLISNEGFDEAACEYVSQHEGFCSSKRQLEILLQQIGATAALQPVPTEAPDEFLVVVPMGEENELIAASAVEQIARRLTFPPQAINQIKTAIVEACINASEHSHSPDRKIYQRFRVESDRLVVTISSRGIVPTNVGSNNAHFSKPESSDAAEERRGWGLKLIRSLMDEVEFERVDEGTSLRMTKYLRTS